MGINLKEIVIENEITFKDLKNKTLAVDAYNLLYQFITTILQFDGTPLTDSNGNITAHLVGLMSRLKSFYENNIKLVFVFDGKALELKKEELQKRKEVKEKAFQKLQEASIENDYDAMKKYSKRIRTIDENIVNETKEFLNIMGIPYIDAFHDAEPQAAYLVNNGICYGVLSQDFDNLLFGAKRFIKNLSITGKRKIQGRTIEIKPKIIELDENLKKLEINQEQLIILGLLIGTDFNNKGIPKIGPKTALKLVKEYKDNYDKLFEEIKWNDYFKQDWKEIYNIFNEPRIKKDVKIEFKEVDENKLKTFLIDKHDFSENNVNKFLENINKKEQQISLESFF
ncbi:MAG: flap endonuclease-1 [Candidatus Nanoarchaeia archaeon]|nr:flap endonuclease-1 [Candidatus Nanoarchaeia archaeon]